MTWNLEDLRTKDLPRCTPERLGFVFPVQSNTTDVLKFLVPYLSDFVDPESNCPGCGSKLHGFFGSFTWGVVHGFGHCGACFYPCRAYHVVPNSADVGGGKDLRFTVILAFHPSVLRTSKEQQK